jgi:phosphoenolpyruvate synthase/pyruvate phosphate dikinase
MYIINTKDNARSEIVGKKAWNLFLLKKYFPIPEFAVITTKGFKDYRKYKKLKRDSLLSGLQVLLRICLGFPLLACMRLL